MCSQTDSLILTPGQLPKALAGSGPSLQLYAGNMVCAESPGPNCHLEKQVQSPKPGTQGLHHVAPRKKGEPTAWRALHFSGL